MSSTTTETPRRAVLAALLLLILLGVAACGDSGENAPPPPDYATALADAPPRLARLYSQGDELAGGGLDAYHAELERLRGYPVVVNTWASWCGPCRVEFPYFQRLVAKEGDHVAFLGVDSDDSDDAARTYLDEFPVPYPSYTDSDREIAEEITDNAPGPPATTFYDSNGQRTYLHVGQYASQEALAADIQRYAR
jgi:cytochrome c biogenesis protein CcmG, thiol:disulfide interchange protein DsbE